MSMTINTANYISGTPQTRFSESVQTEEKNSADKAGKTQQSSVSARLDQVNLGEDGIAIAQVSRMQGSEQTQAAAANVHNDTVEISEEGRAASIKLQQQQMNAIPETSEEETAEDSSTSLSEYTDAELKQMYYNGEITRQEYEEETGEILE